jgi:UDP-GlcNAc:undecaprenyl-phosphate/decaprenyl-phosphate GlcNAc-1-phosphate transferase
MDIILLGTALAFFITYMSIPAIITVSERKKLFDEPDARKLHLTPVPSLGGLGIFAGLMMGVLLSIQFVQAPAFQYIIASSLVIFFLGIKDDIIVLSPIKKLVGQFIAAFLLMYKGGFRITSMHGFLGVQELPELMSITITLFTIIVIINSFNLIDGVDGLAASLGLLTTAVFGMYFFKAGELPYAILSFVTAGSLTGFLIFNHSPARIFMGDTGSLLIGLVNAVLVIHFISSSGSVTSSVPLAASPAIGFAILMVPLFDTLRVFSLRILSRKSPFSPDRNHVHHLLLDLGLSHAAVTYILVGANLAFMSMAYFLRGLGTSLLLIAMLGLAAFITLMLLNALNKKRAVVDTRYPDSQPTIDTQRLISFRRKKIVLPEDN